MAQIKGNEKGTSVPVPVGIILAVFAVIFSIMNSLMLHNVPQFWVAVALAALMIAGFVWGDYGPTKKTARRVGFTIWALALFAAAAWLADGTMGWMLGTFAFGVLLGTWRGWIDNELLGLTWVTVLVLQMLTLFGETLTVAGTFNPGQPLSVLLANGQAVTVAVQTQWFTYLLVLALVALAVQHLNLREKMAENHREMKRQLNRLAIGSETLEEAERLVQRIDTAWAVLARATVPAKYQQQLDTLRDDVRDARDQLMLVIDGKVQPGTARHIVSRVLEVVEPAEQAVEEFKQAGRVTRAREIRTALKPLIDLLAQLPGQARLLTDAHRWDVALENIVRGHTVDEAADRDLIDATAFADKFASEESLADLRRMLPKDEAPAVADDADDDGIPDFLRRLASAPVEGGTGKPGAETAG